MKFHKKGWRGCKRLVDQSLARMGRLSAGVFEQLPVLTALSLTAAAITAQPANASGWIVVDPIGGVVPVAPLTPVTPRTTLVRPPGSTTPLAPRRPVLQGGISYGLHLQSESVKVEIKDQIAKTFISQTFANDTDRNLAGTYLFPLPDDTTFSSFSLHIDGKPVEGKILEANAARQQYEQIVRQMVDPGLLEFADYKTVRARIFPIPANGTKTVELEYTQLLKAENGLLKYRFPLKAKIEQSPADEIKVAVKLNSKQGLRTIWSPTHVISADRPDNLTAKVSMVEHNTVPDKDFLLYYSISNNELAANLISHKVEGEDGYYLMTLTPPVKAASVVGKDVVLVADTSGSMKGDKMEQNKKALKYVINALNASDRFSLVAFNTDAEAFESKLIEATPANKKRAIVYVEELEARGGTNIGDAISIGKTILSDPSARPAYMIFMTDGEPTVGERDVNNLIKLASAKKDIRVFDFGVGYDINTRLLDKLAEAHHGTSEYVEPDENLETALSSFYDKIKSPVLSDVKIAYNGVDVKNVYPRDVKDIFAGSQVLLIGRYKIGANATINLTGKVNGVAKAYTFPLKFSQLEAGNNHLSKLWAMRRIGYLTDVAKANGENKEVVDEIVALSKKYGIISQYTSYLVTDPSENGRLANRPGSPIVATMRRESSAIGPARRRVASHVFPPAPMAAPAVVAGGGLRGGAGGASGVSWGRSVSSSGDSMYKSGLDDSLATSSSRVRGTLADRKSLRSPGSALKDEEAGARFRFASNKFKADFRSAAETRDLIAKMPESGAKAVIAAKENVRLKNTNSPAEQISLNRVQSIGDKTFNNVSGDLWVDSAYSSKGAKPKVIVFNSTQYFDLLKSQPEIGKYLSVGKELIVVFKGVVYKIVQSGTATG